MKNPILNIVLGIIFLFNLSNLQASSVNENSTLIKRDPINYTIILDLSDRVLNDNQLPYDIEQIKTMFNKFKQTAKQNLIITSKDRFIVKSIKDKNNRLNQLEAELPGILKRLESEALYGKKNSDYAGVDMWLFLKENQENLAFPGYKNTIVIMTDGYLDFESYAHVMKNGNRFTSTKFISKLNSDSWKTDADDKDLGILPVSINFNATWVISGLKSKNPNDLMQLSKLKYFWTKWIRESAKENPKFINYST